MAMVINELRLVVNLRSLAMFMGCPAERSLEEMIRTGTGRYRFFGVHEYVQLLMLHRMFYPNGTEHFRMEDFVNKIWGKELV